MLVDHQIVQDIRDGIIHLDPQDGYLTRVQPASLDVRLGERFLHLNRFFNAVVDPKEDLTEYWIEDHVPEGEHFVLHPGELILAATKERVGLPQNMLARVEGKSSLGRLGILVHATAGFIDPGWPMATITLEISNVLGVPIKLYPGMPIAQLAFQRTALAVQGYDGKYTGQEAPVPSHFYENWTGTQWT